MLILLMRFLRIIKKIKVSSALFKNVYFQRVSQSLIWLYLGIAGSDRAKHVVLCLKNNIKDWTSVKAILSLKFR